MSSLIEAYNEILRKLSALRDRLGKTEKAIGALNVHRETYAQARIQRLREQLEKIDEYKLKIEAFRQIAERNLESRNVLTIEAPPGYRVNLNRLRQWAMMIDPLSSNDPYAQRVYLVAKCDELFLEKKRKEFTARIQELEAQDTQGDKDSELQRLNTEKARCLEELRQFVMGEDMLSFARAVEASNRQYWYQTAPEQYRTPDSSGQTVSPGAYALPLELPEEQREAMKGVFGMFYDTAGGRVLLPLELGRESEFALEVVCTPSRTRQLDKALQNLALSLVDRSQAGSLKVYVLDAVRYNSSSMGSLRQLEDTFALASIPRNPEQLSAALEEIVSSFADMDELMEQSDSVIEYNRSLGSGKADRKPLPRKLLILIGRPSAFEGADREHISRIMTSYERYGISFVNVVYRSDWKGGDRDSELTEYASQNAVRVRMMPRDTFVQTGDEAQQRFTWYTLSQALGEGYVKSLKTASPRRQTRSNVYTERHSAVDLPAYTREYRRLELPFGIDGKEREGSISFENENFAAYLVGASRSGKSTLLHTLIAGIIRNYHPDNVELWLADFKQLEFKRYIRHQPPHVKYVLLDESTELVYDLVDKLTAEMLERQKLFSRLGVQRIDQVDVTKLDKPLPVIFVILDEFSIMSQSLADSPVYRLRLQNILAKGAGLGIRFLFSSQTFTTGVSGLTPTARAQIQQRIAMKGSREEISETLELSASLKSDQVKNWMDALPPHYALVKFRPGADQPPEVRRYLVEYFPDYRERDRMIERIRSRMQPVETYAPDQIDTYVDKKPVLVDGNTFDAYDSDVLRVCFDFLRREGTGDERYLAFGTPRLMEHVKPVTLTAETRENLLLIARNAEQACAASILFSALRAFQAQGGRVEVWAYGRNPLFKAYSALFTRNVTLVEGIDAVCDAIRALKADIRDRKPMDKLILLLGIDRICMDFDYVEAGAAPKKKEGIAEVREGFARSGALVSSEADEAAVEKGQAWLRRRREYKDQLKKEGKTREETDRLMTAEKERFFREWNSTHPAGPTQKVPAPVQAQRPEEPAVEPKNITGAYAAQGDFVYVMKQGSRLGCHFFLTLNDLADLKTCGLKMDNFRYRMAFQLSVDDSRSLFAAKTASTLPEHICQFDDSLDRYSFRPYLHPGIGWEGWSVDETGKVLSPFGEDQDD